MPRIEKLDRDPKDEPYLNLAIAAKATYLVSRDRDLLDLMADPTFRQRHPDLLILDPVEFLREIERLEASHSDIEQTQPRSAEEVGSPDLDTNGEEASPS